MAVMGKPIRAYLDQNHQAHIQVHQFQAEHMPPQQQPAMMAHIQDHMAMAHYMQFAQMGLPMPPMEWYPDQSQPMYPDISPQIETQIALAAAQDVAKLVQQQQAAEAAKNPPAPAQQPPVSPEQQFQADQTVKAAAFQEDQRRKDAAVAAEVDRRDALAGLSPTLVKQATDFVEQNKLQMSPRELAVLSKSLGMPFDQVVQAVSRMMSGGQGGSQFEQTTGMVNKEPNFQ